jgi:hypothetical protein
MGFSSRYIESTRCLLQYLDGEICIKDIHDALNDLLLHIDQKEDINAILPDLTGVTKFNVSSNEMLNFAQMTVTKSKNVSKIYFALVASNPVVFGMNRMWEVYSRDSGWITDTFRTREEAESWLCSNLDINSLYK